MEFYNKNKNRTLSEESSNEVREILKCFIPNFE